MTDRIVIPVPGVGVLVLERSAFDAALVAGAELIAAPASTREATAPLYVDAEELARLTDTSASWWESAARDLDCPSLFVGRVRRFKVSDCLAWLESVQERSPDGRSIRCAAAPRARA